MYSISGSEKIAINDLCPEGYSFLNEPRKQAKGGGIGLHYRNSLVIKKVIVHQTIKTFEYMHVEISGVSLVHLLIVYRPPPSTGNKFTTTEFLQEFKLLLNELVLTAGALLIAGDFNLHWDIPTKTDVGNFVSILESMDLLQHVISLTHKHGHTLDLVISRRSDHILNTVQVETPICLKMSATSSLYPVPSI